MNINLATLSVLTGLAMAGAVVAADQVTAVVAPPAESRTITVQQADPSSLAVPNQAFINGGQAQMGRAMMGRGYDSFNYQAAPPAYERGNMMYGSRDARDIRGAVDNNRGIFRKEIGRGGERGHYAGGAIVAGITIALAWLLMLLGIKALITYLKKNDACPLMNWSWRRKKEVTETK